MILWTTLEPHSIFPLCKTKKLFHQNHFKTPLTCSILFFYLTFKTAEKSGQIERSKNARQRQNDFKVSKRWVCRGEMKAAFTVFFTVAVEPFRWLHTSAMLIMLWCCSCRLENDPGSDAVPREAGPRSPAPPQHPGGWREAVRGLGGEGWAVWTLVGPCHPNSEVNMVNIYSSRRILQLLCLYLKIETMPQTAIAPSFFTPSGKTLYLHLGPTLFSQESPPAMGSSRCLCIRTCHAFWASIYLPIQLCDLLCYDLPHFCFLW